MFRRFIHKRPLLGNFQKPAIWSLPMGENLMEKLKVMAISQDQIRLDGLAPPEPEPESLPVEKSGLTTEETKKLLRVAQLEAVKSKLREVQKSWPLNARIRDLMKQMTMVDHIGQVTQIERTVATHDVMTKYFIGNVLSGSGSVPTPKASAKTHNNVYNATIFPHNVGLGVTRDPNLVKRIGEANALKVRATRIPYVFAPCIAVCRNLRWGRCYESYSEDHKIVQAMTEIISGLQ
ncbi:hypothetical protein FF1_025059 [Malus domestica]